jgi:predicted exporter
VWSALIPLRGVVEPLEIQRRATGSGAAGLVFVDLKSESANLLQVYQHEAVMLALIGGLVILILMSGVLRSPRRVYRVLAPLVAAVIVTMAILTGAGRSLSIFGLMGLLLAVAVGSNYSLFFERQGSAAADRQRTVASVVIANLCTVIGFGVLSISQIPVLNGVGTTVAIGAMLGLLFAAVLTSNEGDLER